MGIVEVHKTIERKSIFKRHLQLCDDQIYIVPQKDEYVDILFDYVLKRSILLWNLYRKYLPKPTIKSKKRNVSINILKKIVTFDVVRSIYKKIKQNKAGNYFKN